MTLKFCVVAGVFQALVMVLFGVLVEYSDDALPPHKRRGNFAPITNNTSKRVNDITVFYPMFQDVHVMIYIGFGFLMTFLKKYGYGAVGYNFFIAAMLTQWATIATGSFHQIYIEDQGHIGLNIQALISAEFAAAAVLITYGAVLGKVSRLQLLVIGIAEVIFYAINEMIATKYLKYSDAGGSIIIHSFGAYFGLALSRVLYTKEALNHYKEESVYHSDLFAMIGTVFLWLYWPSFNAVLVAPDYVAQHRSVINTYLSLASACVTTFALSPVFQRTSGKWKISMVHVQNATLAGGVAIGTASNMSVTPLGALLVGSCAGALSTVGYVYLTPLLTKYAKIHDTCGVNNLHGMPGVLGAIVGAILAAQADTDTYGLEGLINIWSARGDGRSAQAQAGFQIAGLAVTLGIAIAGGVMTGFAVKWKIFNPPTQEQYFDDEDYWEVPNEESLQIQCD